MRAHVHAVFYLSRIHEVRLEVRDALEKYRFVSHGNVIEQNQMLVNLSHVPDVRNHSQPELSSQQAHRQELGNARNPGAVHLHDLYRLGMHEVLKHDSVGDVLAQRNRNWLDRFCDCAVRSNIVWMCWFFHEVRRDVLKLRAHLQRTWKSPLLIGIDHDQRIRARELAQHEGSPNIALAIVGSNL